MGLSLCVLVDDGLHLGFRSQGSLDSLLSHDDDDRESLSDLVNDPELAPIDEPENWQSVVDKKVVKKHGKKEVMRQERIYGQWTVDCERSVHSLLLLCSVTVSVSSFCMVCGVVEAVR